MYLILAVKGDKHLLLSSAESAAEAVGLWEAAQPAYPELLVSDGSVGAIDHAELVRRAEAERSAGDILQIGG